ncbi:Salicylate carboxymethyltransferase [Dichanthelium oligosanthes]|uniref:Salicylate carboxymethyltransferase n=1 Tax=Dichanthelium oligosanthes TaxID=888268 RepID=A0A1E5WNG6_9POAL|nr:Salicylate carboxymethyltransferase [Dichanthelium oligosanthes]
MEDEVVLMARSSSAAAVVRMNSSGEGKMSYANNSDFQRVIASVTRKARRDMAAALYRARGRAASLVIADLGCGTGPNALLMASDAVEAVLAENNKGAKDARAPQLHVFLNDLPTNDFNAVFRLLPSSLLVGTGCLVSAWPSSFHGRVFPEASLDYVVSSSSLHFLSKAPSMATEHLNRGRVYVSEASPAAVLDAYRGQFHADFLAFLCCRAAETRPRGLLLLTFVARRAARPTAHDCYLWDLLADALMDMATAGLVDEEQVHSFNAPYYGPCPDDLARVIAKEGSFAVRTMKLFDTTRRRLRPASRPANNKHDDDGDDDELPRWLAVQTAGTVRAVVEPMMRTHFGWAAIDGLFCRYRLLLEAYYRSKTTRNKDDITNVFLVLEKKH